MSKHEQSPADDMLEKFNAARLANDVSMQQLTTAEAGQIAAMYLLPGDGSANHELAIAASSNYAAAGRTLFSHKSNQDGSITTTQTGMITNEQGTAHVALEITLRVTEAKGVPEITDMQARRLEDPTSPLYQAIYASRSSPRRNGK